MPANAGLDTGRGRIINPQPGGEMSVRLRVPLETAGRWKIDDPFDQFGSLQSGRGVVPALELGASQSVAVLQFGDGVRR
jgi:hypothetical protein